MDFDDFDDAAYTDFLREIGYIVDEGDDFVISTGRQASVREFIEICGRELNWNKDSNSNSIIWEGEGINEIGKRADTNEIVIKIDAKYFRPCEVNSLLGDANKANKKLGWSPKTTLEELVLDMIKSDLALAKKESLLKKKGYEISFTKD